jgi:hypothetical protein
MFLFGGQRGKHMPGHAGDRDARTARRDDFAEFLQHKRGAQQVYGQDCFG